MAFSSSLISAEETLFAVAFKSVFHVLRVLLKETRVSECKIQIATPEFCATLRLPPITDLAQIDWRFVAFVIAFQFPDRVGGQGDCAAVQVAQVPDSQ